MPWASDTESRKSAEIELATNFRFGTAGVRNIVRIEREHVGENVGFVVRIWKEIRIRNHEKAANSINCTYATEVST